VQREYEPSFVRVVLLPPPDVGNRLVRVGVGQVFQLVIADRHSQSVV
jgi:hypothetical protein